MATRSLDYDGTAKHVHPTPERKLAGCTRRELNDDRLVEGQRTPDIERRKHDFRPAGFVGGPDECNS